MNKYSIAYTRANLTDLLKILPFEITRYGTVIARVVGYTSNDVVQHTSATKLPSKNEEKQNVVQHTSATKLCEHGFPKGLCKKGCK